MYFDDLIPVVWKAKSLLNKIDSFSICKSQQLTLINGGLFKIKNLPKERAVYGLTYT